MPVYNYIISDNPIDVHKKIWAHIKPIFPRVVMGMIIVYLLLNAVPEILGYFIPKSYMDIVSQFFPMEESVRKMMPDTSAASVIYAVFMNGVLKTGCALFVLTIIRAKKADIHALFEGFTIYRKAATLFILEIVLVSFWSFFFIIPGIYMAISLSLIYFILAENPDRPVLHILAESRIMMRGNKMYLIRLFLYFVPVMFACSIPGLLVGRFEIASTDSLIGLLIYFVADLPLYAAMGYFTIAMGVVYELIRSRGFSNFKYAGQEVFRMNMDDVDRRIFDNTEE